MSDAKAARAMGCRLRALVWGLTGVCVVSCLYTVNWLSPTGVDMAKREPIPFAALPSTGSELVIGGADVVRMWRRQEAVKDACLEGSGRVWGDAAVNKLAKYPHRQHLQNFIVDDKNQVIYCYVPKVACTNWKRMMLILTGRTNVTDPMAIPSDSVHRKNVFRMLSDLSQPAAVRERLLTYSKFLFVRHPIERVVSAFRNKFEKNYTSSAYFKKHFGVKIMQKYRKGVPPESIPSSGHGVRFPEFVSYLIDTKLKDYNEHWAPVATLCFPCDVRYNFTGKYETLGEDSKFILEQIGAPPSLHFPDVVPSRTTAAVVESYFGSLTKEQQTKLVQIYADDFRLFGYDVKDYI